MGRPGPASPSLATSARTKSPGNAVCGILVIGGAEMKTGGVSAMFVTATTNSRVATLRESTAPSVQAFWREHDWKVGKKIESLPRRWAGAHKMKPPRSPGQTSGKQNTCWAFLGDRCWQQKKKTLSRHLQEWDLFALQSWLLLMVEERSWKRLLENNQLRIYNNNNPNLLSEYT